MFGRSKKNLRDLPSARPDWAMSGTVRVVEFTCSTARLTLRPWRDSDLDDFAAMNADPEVSADLGGPLSRAESETKLQRFRHSFDHYGLTRWAVLDDVGQFLGYAGIRRHGEGERALPPHHDIGWRFTRSAWGNGYASEAAAAALDDAFDRVGLEEVLAYTAPDNLRSQAVMNRLGMRRDPSRDFVDQDERMGTWTGLTWSMTAAMWST